MEKILLNNAKWKLSNDKIGTMDVTVPGCVHTDLLKNKIVEDYFWRDNSKNVQWIENEDFEYSCTFDAKAGKNVFLVFEGLDTYTDIFLNGTKLGSTENMFIPHEFDVSNFLLDGENSLVVKFRSPIKAVQGMPEHPAAFTNERINTRRIQCTYFWDWVDRFVTCGIFRPVYLKYADDMYIENIYVSTDSIDKFSAQIYCEIELKNYENGGMVFVEILDPNENVVTKTSFFAREKLFVRRFDIVNPKLWYPIGYGEHPLYTIKVKTGNNELSDKFGIRTVKILQAEDKVGSEYYNLAQKIQNSPLGQLFDHNEKFSGFMLIVNGEQVFCKGANWVPFEPFPSAQTPKKYEKLINMATEMNLNFLRVWGGGYFENDYFYDLCDQNGIIVVQDFLMACGEYPEKDEWFLNALALEAEFAVKNLRNHPCLAWWHGDNENARLGSDTQEDYLGRDSALRGNGPIIYKYDRMRQFLPSSPYGGNTYASITSGTSHTTNFCPEMFTWFLNTDGSNFKEFFEQFVSRFISEEPILGMASNYTLKKTMTENDMFFDDSEEILRFHTKNNPEFFTTVFQGGKELTESFFGKFVDGKDRMFKYRYLQYEWVRVVFENIRRNIGYCNGMVFWMFADCWPASMGWSIIDYYCQPKGGYYSFKRCANSLLSSVTVKDNKYKYFISNDGHSQKELICKAYLMDMKNSFKLCDEYEFKATATKYSAVSVDLPWGFDENMFVVVETFGEDFKDRCFYQKGNMFIKKCDDVKLVSKTENTITVKADKYVHAVEFDGAYIFDDNYFSLMPNQEKTIHFKKWADDADEIIVTSYSY